MKAEAAVLVAGLWLAACGDDGEVGPGSTGSDDGGTRTESGEMATTSSMGTMDGGSGTTAAGTTTSSTTASGTTTAGCEVVTDDPSGIGQACMLDDECLEGYTCQDFEGVVLERSCQIRCEEDCECPTGYVCVDVMDKVHAWRQCAPR